MAYDAVKNALMASIRPGINGAVTGSMEQRGIVYGVNYGVSVPLIKTAVERVGGDGETALMLFGDRVRELRLAGIFMAEPSTFTPDEARRWYSGVDNPEIAEHFASSLAGRSPYAVEIAKDMAAAGDHMLFYAAILTLSSALGSVCGPQEALESFKALAPRLETPLHERAAERLLTKLLDKYPHCATGVDAALCRSGAPGAMRLRENIAWLLP